MPDDWQIHQLAELWNVPPWVAADAPAFWAQRALFYHKAKNRAERDRMENEEALRKAQKGY